MPASKLTNKQVLVEKPVWALLTYSDGSQFCFQTTLNQDILRDKGIILEEGKLPRLDKTYYMYGKYVYRQFSIEGASISLWDGEHYDDPASCALKDFL